MAVTIVPKIVGGAGYDPTAVAITGGSIAGVSGVPVLLAQSFVGVTAPGDTNENTLATISVPANTLGANGALFIDVFFTHTNSANNKVLRVRYSGASGTQYIGTTVTTTASSHYLAIIGNRNATNSQVGWPGGTGTIYGSSTIAVTTSAVDTAADTTIVITGQKASAGETITLEWYSVRYVRPVV